jgi:RNA polymerase sigma-B factor
MSTNPRTKRSATQRSSKRNGRPPADSVEVTNAIRMDGHLADENDLLREYAETHDPRLKEELVRRFLPLARSLALRYRGASEQLDDLIQVASLGLVKALDGFDLERGNSFIAYAAPTILGELRRHFRDATWAVRPPRDLQELSMAVERARDPLTAALGREPTLAELAERLRRSPEAVAEALQAGGCRCLQSLDGPAGEDELSPATIGELIGADDTGYERAEARLAFERFASVVDQRAREILELRFHNDLLQSQIADRVGLSQMQVSRIIRASLERITAASFA